MCQPAPPPGETIPGCFGRPPASVRSRRTLCSISRSHEGPKCLKARLEHGLQGAEDRLRPTASAPETCTRLERTSGRALRPFREAAGTCPGGGRVADLTEVAV